MNDSPFLQIALAHLAPFAKETLYPTPQRLDLVLDKEDLFSAVQTLHQAQWGYLATITGLDLGDQFEVLYHFCAGNSVVTLRVKVERENPVIPTICPIIPSASFSERELMEMFGITVAGTPNPARLFLPEQWTQGVYPLRKDFQQEVA